MSSSAIFNAAGLPSDHLPTVTVGMLMGFLADYDVLAQPRASRRVFRWFEAEGSAFSTRPHNLRSGQVLVICHAAQARKILSADKSAFACALSPDGSVPLCAAECAERLVVIRQKDTFSYFLFLVQRFFTDVMMWEDELDRIVLRKGSLHELLNVGNSAIGDFMLCVDTSGTVLAHTEGTRAPTEELAQAVATGYLPARAIEADVERPGLGTTDEHGERSLLCRDVTADGVRFATLVLASAGTVAPGTRDLLSTLFKRVEPLCIERWHSQARMICPHHSFFTRLLEGGEFDDDYVKAHLQATDIPVPSQLKLILLDLRHDGAGLSLPEASAAAGRINHGMCYCFAHQGSLCVLCYASEGDNQLSHKKSAEDVERFVSGPLGVPATSSQIFENVTDLDLAYRQATIARNLRSVVESEEHNALRNTAADNEDVSAPHGSNDVPALIPFENCLLYYLVGAADKDERFLQFSFSHTLMQKISAEDATHGTNYLEIFWQYLACERNATAVAERLHLHRNTVLYRIDKLQKRFDLDLSSQGVREKMLVDFKVFFLMQNRTSIRRLFEETE